MCGYACKNNYHYYLSIYCMPGSLLLRTANFKSYVPDTVLKMLPVWIHGRLLNKSLCDIIITYNPYNISMWYFYLPFTKDFLVAQTVKVCLQCRRPRFNPWGGKISWRRKWQPTPVFLPGKSHGQEEPGRLQSMGWQSRTRLSDFTFTFTLQRKEPK